MEIQKRTVSVCPECLKEIPAIVQVMNSGVSMVKECPDHGHFVALIEKDPLFYMTGEMLNRGNIYNGLFVDVTNRCNTVCKYCYHGGEGDDPTADSIVKQCADHSGLAPFIMVGGEPTVREDLPDLIRRVSEYGPVYISTNGLKLADPDYVCSLPLVHDGVFNASISLHPLASNSSADYLLKIKAIENVLGLGCKLFGLIFVIDSIDQVDEVIKVNRMFGGRITSNRIKIATAINKTNRGAEIYNSDIYNYLHAKAKAEKVQFDIDHTANNKAAYFNMIYDGIPLTAVKWYTKYNVDLADINCGPWHVNKDGRVLNMDHSLILGG